VKARGRDWVVLPSDDAEVLVLRPLSGGEDDICGIYLPLESADVAPSQFARPATEHAGDFLAGKLLRQAARLGLRSTAAPLRALGRVSVQPRPYQLVPLIMALRLDPVRMLIADDVGIGKTIEAALVARELLGRAAQREAASLQKELAALEAQRPYHLLDLKPYLKRLRETSEAAQDSVQAALATPRE
jgi:hypothetical protein